MSLEDYYDLLESETFVESVERHEDTNRITVKFWFRPEEYEDCLLLTCDMIVPDCFPVRTIDWFCFKEPVPFHVNVKNKFISDVDYRRTILPGGFSHKYQSREIHQCAYDDENVEYSLSLFILYFGSIWRDNSHIHSYSYPLPNLADIFDEKYDRYVALQNTWFELAYRRQFKRWPRLRRGLKKSKLQRRKAKRDGERKLSTTPRVKPNPLWKEYGLTDYLKDYKKYFENDEKKRRLEFLLSSAFDGQILSTSLTFFSVREETPDVPEGIRVLFFRSRRVYDESSSSDEESDDSYGMSQQGERKRKKRRKKKVGKTILRSAIVGRKRDGSEIAWSSSSSSFEFDSDSDFDF